MKRWTAISAAFALAASAGMALAQEMGSGGESGSGKAAQKAQSGKLKVGDPAPAMNVDKWVKGDAITGFEKGRVYVVEFWATWCGPCIRSMPHLSAIQKEYKDRGLTVIGVTSGDENGNTLEAVEKMVTAKGDKMAYTVAWDKERKTSDAFMTAAGQSGIPCSFVVDQKGNIAYIGHPMTLDFVLGSVLDGKWDYATDPEKAQAAYKDIAKQKREIARKFEDDPKAAMTQLEAFEAKHPKFAFDAEQKFQFQVQAGDPAANQTGMKLVNELIKEGNALQLNEFAWNLVDPEGDIKNPPLDAALKAAEEAVKLTKEKDGAILDTLARVWWLKGDKGKAIQLQKKAIEHAQPDYKQELEDRLKEYEADSKN